MANEKSLLELANEHEAMVRKRFRGKNAPLFLPLVTIELSTNDVWYAPKNADTAKTSPVVTPDAVLSDYEPHSAPDVPGSMYLLESLLLVAFGIASSELSRETPSESLAASPSAAKVKSLSSMKKDSKARKRNRKGNSPGRTNKSSKTTSSR